MRNLLLVCAVCATAVGCGEPANAPLDSTYDHEAVARRQLGLKWPGVPQMTATSVASTPGGEWRVSISYSQWLTEGSVTFEAEIAEYPEEEIKRTTPKKMLEAYVNERIEAENIVTREEIQHGPAKHPGLAINIRYKRGGLGYERRVIVLAGRKLHVVSINGLSEEHLRSNEAKEFFESFTTNPYVGATEVVSIR